MKKGAPEKVRENIELLEEAKNLVAEKSNITLTITAEKLNVSRGALQKTINRHAYSHGHTTWKDFKKGVISKLGVESPGGDLVFFNTKKWEARIGYLCAVFSTNKQTWKENQFSYVKPGTNYCKEIEVVNDRLIQPIKRVRVAAHAYTHAGVWSNGEKTITPTIKIASTMDEVYLTSEDACIVSTEFSNQEGLQLGDKIMGINGLKCIVGDIRDCDKDIIINIKQIYGDKESRRMYGAVKEYRDRKGKLEVFFPTQTLREKGEEKENEKE